MRIIFSLLLRLLFLLTLAEDAKDTTKKRKIIGNTRKASICLDARDNILQKQEQADPRCGFPPKVAESAGPPPTLSLSSASVFVSLYCISHSCRIMQYLWVICKNS